MPRVTSHGVTVGRDPLGPDLRVDLATVHELATKAKPYIRADGTRIWSLMQLERQLHPEAYRRRRGGYLDRRRTPATGA